MTFRSSICYQSIFLLYLAIASTNAFSQQLNVKEHYNVIGDGEADDTNEIVAAIKFIKSSSQFNTVFLPNGEYRITKTLRILNGVNIAGSHAVILFDPKSPNDNIVMELESDILVRGISINGSNNANFGINIDNRDNVTIKDLNIFNLLGSSSSPAHGIRVVNKSKNISISQTKIHNLFAYENGIQGDSIGANRGIYFGEVYDSSINDCIVNNIEGYEDGDAIHIQAKDSFNLNILIDNCLIYNFGKRGIKLQASGVKVSNNRIFGTDLSFLSRISNNEITPGVHSGISVGGKNIEIYNNTIILGSAIAVIDIFNSDSVIVKNNFGGITKELDTNQKIPRVRKSFSRAMYLFNSSNCIIEDNKLYSNYAGLHLKKSFNNNVQNNYIGYSTNGRGIVHNVYWEEDSFNNRFSGNKFLKNKDRIFMITQ